MSTAGRTDGIAHTYDGPSPKECLVAFDKAWVIFLEQFVVWQIADAAVIEVRIPLIILH